MQTKHILIVFVIIVLLLLWTLFLRRSAIENSQNQTQTQTQQTDIAKQQSESADRHPTVGEEATQLTISLTPSEKILKTGESFTVAVRADGSEEIRAIDIYLQYDNTSLSLQRATPGSYFVAPTVLFENIDTTAGILIYSLGAVNADRTKKEIAFVTFRAMKKSDMSSVSLDPKTLVSLKGGLTANPAISGKAAYRIQ